MILVINVCVEKLHYYEFVKPIEDVLKGLNVKFFTRHYLDLQKGDLMNCKKVIICGTSLLDNKFLKDINYFSFLKNENFRKPVFGICAGMQIIGLIDDLNRQVGALDIKSDFSHVLKKKLEIGFFHEKFDSEFLGLVGDVEVYHLHGNYVARWGDDWEIFAKGNGVVQAVRRGSVYGVLFHPEVRNKGMIREFIDLK